MQDKNTRKRSRKVLGAIIVVVFCLLAAIYVVVEKSGKWLVVNDEFEHATWAIILDGQSANMERNDYVADLKAQGKVDSVLILGRRVYRDRSNVDFYAEDFMRLGKFNPATIFLVRHDDPSTLSEACTIIPWLKKHKADSVLLVTSAPATRRAKRIFQTLSGDSPVYLTKDIDNKSHYIADAWIFNRESRKNWLREWFALAHSYLDLAGAYPLSESDSTYFSKIRSIAEEEKDEPVIDLFNLQKTEETPEKELPRDTVAAPAPAGDSAQATSSSQASTNNLK
jgi:uncharacterized SAM-binding protein YcdF (DUF218 family)